MFALVKRVQNNLQQFSQIVATWRQVKPHNAPSLNLTPSRRWTKLNVFPCDSIHLCDSQMQTINSTPKEQLIKKNNKPKRDAKLKRREEKKQRKMHSCWQQQLQLTSSSLRYIVLKWVQFKIHSLFYRITLNSFKYTHYPKKSPHTQQYLNLKKKKRFWNSKSIDLQRSRFAI